MLIAVEGIDGSGKTTIARYIKEILETKGLKCVLLKEPGDSTYGKKIRESKLRLEKEEELKLFILDRIEDVNKNILPALKEGKVVIMDRYYLSNIAYQSVRGIDAEKIRKMNEKIAPKPDLVILLDVDPEVGLERVKKRGKLTPFEEPEYLKKVREAFVRNADSRTVIVDANRPLEEVKKEVRSILCSRINF
jgi:dTMP kinase